MQPKRKQGSPKCVQRPLLLNCHKLWSKPILHLYTVCIDNEISHWTVFFPGRNVNGTETEKGSRGRRDRQQEGDGRKECEAPEKPQPLPPSTTSLSEHCAHTKSEMKLERAVGAPKKEERLGGEIWKNNSRETFLYLYYLNFLP